MSQASRLFDDGRKRQGVRDQAHLDAFFRCYDHKTACPVCSTIGGAVPLDDGMQPIMGECETGLKLYKASI